MNAVNEALLAYSRQEVSNTAVVRAMAESADWYVPIGFAAGKLGVRIADHVVILSTDFGGNPRVLSIFTNREAANLAEGQPLGAFSGVLRGTDVLNALDAAEFDRVDINPGSPRELTFYLDSGAFGLCRLVAQVVRLEQALAQATDTSIPFALLRDHPGYMIAVNTANNVPVTTPVKGAEGEWALVFTSPDRFELYRQSLTAEQRAEVKTVTLPGESLYTQLPNFDIAGLVLNPFCPGTVVLAGHLFPRIVAGG